MTIYNLYIAFFFPSTAMGMSQDFGHSNMPNRNCWLRSTGRFGHPYLLSVIWGVLAATHILTWKYLLIQRNTCLFANSESFNSHFEWYDFTVSCQKIAVGEPVGIPGSQRNGTGNQRDDSAPSFNVSSTDCDPTVVIYQHIATYANYIWVCVQILVEHLQPGAPRVWQAPPPNDG